MKKNLKDIYILLPQVILFTIIELFTEEEEREINHHGAMRIVDDDLQKEDNRQITKTLNAYKIAKKFGNFMIYETKFKIDLHYSFRN